MPTLSVHLIPALTSAADLAGDTVVVIDVLRATSTIITALANGAREVIPCLDIDDARRLAATLPTGTTLLGGERGGLKIGGFDCGNSPAEYAPEVVAGKTLIFTTTNGTRALRLCEQARRTLIGAALNVSAVAAAIENDEAVHLLCAGTDGHVTAEDVLIAGLIARRVITDRPHWRLNDAAQVAVLATAAVSCSAELVPLFRASRGGRNLIEVGLESDIALCANVDLLPLVPEVDLGKVAGGWVIRGRGEANRV